jgi:hypothetical protein
VKQAHGVPSGLIVMLAVGTFACSPGEEPRRGLSSETDAQTDTMACDLPDTYVKPYIMLPFDPLEWIIDDMYVQPDPEKCAELDVVACRINLRCTGDFTAKSYQCFNAQGILTNFFAFDYAGPVPCSKDQLMEWIIAESEECSHTVGFDALPAEGGALLDLSRFKPIVCTNVSRTRFRLQSVDGSILRLTRLVDHYPCDSGTIHAWWTCVDTADAQVWNQSLPFSRCQDWAGWGLTGERHGTHPDGLEVQVLGSCDGKCIVSRFVAAQSIPGDPGPATAYKGLADAFTSCEVDIDVVP